MATAAVTIGRTFNDPDPGAGRVERSEIRRISVRLVPFLFVLYICAYIDHQNLGFAWLQMKLDLKFSAAAYSFGFGVFFLGYALFEVPSNLVLALHLRRQMRLSVL